ncbi:MAG: IS5 family transposase [Prevotellaceae bacterium]|nr:IS5 family transposase [Prevotellaceae bacterium]
MSTSPITRGKDTYKITSWKACNESLCRRGSLTLWLEDGVLKEWELASRQSKEVGEQTYSDGIIQCCLLMRISYRLKLRQSAGFMRSLLGLMGKSHLAVPDYSTLCRRQKSLPVALKRRLYSGEKLAIGIASTGLKVYGEGEWKVRKHGWSKHRTWRKLHVCIDLDTQEILSVALTGNDEDDASVGSKMLAGKTGSIRSFHGDGAYDKFGFRAVLGDGIAQVIPPPQNAVVQKPKKRKPLPAYLRQRNQAVEYISKHGSQSWKEQSGYPRRSLNEVVMFRYKTIFGGALDARTFENQEVEVKLKALTLNKFIGIGMPNAYKAS